MKYIKIFEGDFNWIATEEEKELCRIGNYVILNPVDMSGFLKEDEEEFLKNNIGQIINVERNKYSKIENYFYIIQYKKHICTLDKNNIYRAEFYEIELEYKNKEDLEAYLTSKKYNL